MPRRKRTSLSWGETLRMASYWRLFFGPLEVAVDAGELGVDPGIIWLIGVKDLKLLDGAMGCALKFFEHGRRGVFGGDPEMLFIGIPFSGVEVETREVEVGAGEPGVGLEVGGVELDEGDLL